jgi:hypothetical protein
METTPDHVKEETDLHQIYNIQTPAEPIVMEHTSAEQESELPTQDFLKEERFEEQKSELPAQDFLIEERVSDRGES